MKNIKDVGQTYMEEYVFKGGRMVKLGANRIMEFELEASKSCNELGTSVYVML